MYNLYSRMFIYLFGLFIKSFGLSCIIIAHLGTGAWEGLYVGLSEKIGLSIGSWLILIGILIIMGNAWLMKKKPDFFSLITVLFLGGLMDLWMQFLGRPMMDPFKQFIVFGIGLTFAAIGVSLYIQARFSITPLDQLMYALSQTLGTPIMVSKTIGEIIAFILTLVVEGPVGIGTILFTLLFGPFIGFFIKCIEKLVSHNDTP